MNDENKVAEEMAMLVLDVYRHALKNDLDITDQEDVKQALSTIKPEEINKIDLEVLIQGLVAFDRMTKAELAKRAQPN